MRARGEPSGPRRGPPGISRRHRNDHPEAPQSAQHITHARRRKLPNKSSRTAPRAELAGEPPMRQVPSRRLPSREELVAFIRERSGKVGVREIARAFGAKNADRAALQRMLRDLADEGRIDRHRKRLHHAGTLPPVVLADVTGRDSDGELLARPTEWDEEIHGAPPLIHIVTPRRARPD